METKESAGMEETYQDVGMMIHSVTHAFLRQKDISEREYEEWHGEACMAFANAYQSFDLRREIRFTTWLWQCIWYALSDKLRRDAVHWTTPRLNEQAAFMMIESGCSKSEIELRLCMLTQDAKTVVEIVLSTFGHVDEKEADPEEIRLALYALLSSMGWSARRIVESFHEIRVALTE